MAADDFIMTIDSDTEEALPQKGRGKSEVTVADDAVLNADFSFVLEGDLNDISAFEDIGVRDVRNDRPVRRSF
jgi:hypothetical protein